MYVMFLVGMFFMLGCDKHRICFGDMCDVELNPGFAGARQVVYINSRHRDNL
jgi:hypothetical protein